VKKHLRWIGLVVACIAAAGTAPRADDKPVVPLRVQIVIARYQGDKKVSNLPYTLVVNANLSKTSLRLGSQVPVAATSYTPIASGGAGVNPLTSYQYKDVGINIDCTAGTLDDGRYKLDLAIEDSSVYGEDQIPASASKPGGAASFRRFSSVNTVVLKDGQTSQLTVATGKLNGEVTRVDVTLNVLK
jgi:hypothetical protein